MASACRVRDCPWIVFAIGERRIVESSSVSFSLISSAIAQTAPAAAPATGAAGMLSSLSGMLPLVLMFVVLYFVMIRPQMRKQKEHRTMIEAVAKGDEILTSGGIIGRITRLGEGNISIEISPGVEVQLQRSAISQVLPKGTLKT